MKDGKILKWNYKIGDKVAAGDVIAEIQTDKSTVGYEVQDDGYIAQILAKEGGEAIDVGKPIVVVVKKKDAVAAFTGYTGEEDTSAQAAPGGQSSSQPTKQTVKRTKKVKVPKQNAGNSNLPAHDILKMPSLSPTMKDGKILKWNYKIGDKVAAGDVIAEIQTDKSTVGYEVQDDGYIAQILAKEGGEAIDVGKPIVIVSKKKDSVAAFQNYSPSEEGEEEIEVEYEEEVEVSGQSKSPSQASQGQSSPRREGERIIATPYAKTLAREHKVDLSHISGSGPHGRVKAQDVLQAKSQQATPRETKPKEASTSQTLATGPFQDLPLSQMRKVIGQRLTESKQNLPHYYVTMEIKMDKLIK